MNMEMARNALLWCAVINYGVLLVWFLFVILARDFMHRLHGRRFRLSREQFDMVHYAGMAIFKLGIILFNLLPYVALRIVGWTCDSGLIFSLRDLELANQGTPDGRPMLGWIASPLEINPVVVRRE
jgi:uncharacterized protein DUF6868